MAPTETDGKDRFTIYLATSVAKRLKLASVEMDKSYSAIVEDVLDDALPHYTVREKKKTGGK